MTVLDPYMGSGSTGVACMMAGVNFIGIERDAEYFAIAEKRISAAAADAAQRVRVTAGQRRVLARVQDRARREAAAS